MAMVDRAELQALSGAYDALGLGSNLILFVFLMSRGYKLSRRSGHWR